MERNYIAQVEKQFDRTCEIDKKTVKMNSEINAEKMNKVRKFKELYMDPNNDGKRSKGPQTVKFLTAEIGRLENQLEQANQKLNTTVAYNENLRNKNIDGIYEDLSAEVATKKQEIQDTIELAGKYYEERNQAEIDLKELQKTAEDQKQQFESQMLQL